MCITMRQCGTTLMAPSCRLVRRSDHYCLFVCARDARFAATCRRCCPVAVGAPAARGCVSVALEMIGNSSLQAEELATQIPQPTTANNRRCTLPQFLYGEDGVDVLQTGFLTKFGFQASNADRFAQQLRLGEAAASAGALALRNQEAAVQRAAR